MDSHREYDVVVVGARCAGAATARLLASAGHRVLVIDRADLPSDTLSTHGIARGGVVQLARWGLLDELLGTGAPPIRRVTFSGLGSRTTRMVKDRAGVDLLLAPRRIVLDAVLANAARSAGVTVWTRTSLTGLTYDRYGRVDGVVVTDRRGGRRRVAAWHVVGADGLRSTTARLLGAPVVRRFLADTTLFYAYVEGLDDRGFEFAVAPQGLAGVFPTHDGMSCVWVTRPTRLMDRLRAAGRERASTFAHELGSVDAELGDRVRRSPRISLVRGFVAAPNIIRQAVGPGWSLVGDAASFRDPITGHGITDAFRDAELLARAIDTARADPASEPDALASYAESQHAALDPIFRLTESLARFPEPAAFVDLQIQLSDALDQEARMLAGLPDQPGSRQPAAA